MSDDAALSHASYWDERYARADDSTSDPTHEWFRSFSDLVPFFERHLFTVPGLTPEDNPLILHLGSGDSVCASTPSSTWLFFSLPLAWFHLLSTFYSSLLTSTPTHSPISQTIPVDLAARGYKRQLCVDFSSAVVDLMRARHAAVEGVEWRLLDVRDMQGLADRTVDAAFDKGTLDAMIHGSPWSPPQDVRDNTSAYLREVR